MNIAYDRHKAITYAHTWALGRNPQYYNFDLLGGDCTNFVSQCVYAGCGVMDYTKDLGWYYISANSRAAAWTGVEYLYRFLIANKGPGPYAQEKPLAFAQPGDIVQLSFDGQAYVHSLFIVDAETLPSPENILVATHTYDVDYRALDEYPYRSCRLLHVEGARK